MRRKEKPPETPADFLAWSMNCHRDLSTFQAHCQWTMSVSFDDQASTPDGAANKIRQVQYAKPNRYRIVSNNQRGFVLTTVCDGRQEVDYSNSANLPVTTYSAPASIAESVSMNMKHPHFCGSLLYHFFGGQSYLRALVDKAEEPILFINPLVLEAEACQVVSFSAKDVYYGHTEVAISTRDGLVRRIQYKSERFLQQMQTNSSRQLMQSTLSSLKSTQEFTDKIRGIDLDQFDPLQIVYPSHVLTTESYTNLIVDAPLALEIFDAPPPNNVDTSNR